MFNASALPITGAACCNRPMLKGKELGAAFKEAVARKKVRQREVAAEFGVKQSSVSEWARYGRISKEHIPHLVSWFADVVGPEHWGLPAAWASASAHIRPHTSIAEHSPPYITVSKALIDDFLELLPEDQERFRREIAERAEQMRKHAKMVLERAGVKNVTAAPHPASGIPAAPKTTRRKSTATRKSEREES